MWKTHVCNLCNCHKDLSSSRYSWRSQSRPKSLQSCDWIHMSPQRLPVIVWLLYSISVPKSFSPIQIRKERTRSRQKACASILAPPRSVDTRNWKTAETFKLWAHRHSSKGCHLKIGFLLEPLWWENPESHAAKPGIENVELAKAHTSHSFLSDFSAKSR